MYEISEDLLEEKNAKTLTEQEKEEVFNSFNDVNDDDKLLVLISHFDEGQFRGSKKVVHETFYELKSQFPAHFSSFIFTKCENYPFSKKIDDIFFRFQNYRAVSMKNPNYDIYLISNKTIKTIKEKILPVVKDQDEQFINDLESMVKLIKLRLG